MKIIGCFNIYNEAQFILEALRSAAEACDHIIVVDGSFEGFPKGSGMSTDGTIEIIRDYIKYENHNCELVTRETPWKGMDKVQYYLDMVDIGDYILRMNGDEILEYEYVTTTSKLDLLRYVKLTNELPMYQFLEYRPPLSDNHYDWIPKLIMKTDTLKLTNRHLALTNKFDPPYTLTGEGRNRVSPAEANVPGEYAKVRHMRDHRSAVRQGLNYRWTKHFNAHLKYE